MTRRLPNSETILYGGLVVALLLPVWWNRYFVTQDGPAHLHNSRMLLDHLLGRGLDTYREYYVPNLRLFPYWFGHIVSAVLLFLFPPTLAEKLYLSGYIVLIASALRSLLRRINTDAAVLAFLGLPLVCGRPFQMGFMDFSYSVAILLGVLAYWVRRAGDWSLGPLVVRTLLFLLLYFCHPTVFLLGGAATVCLTAAGVVVRGRGMPVRSALYAAVEPALALGLSALPSMLLLVAFTVGDAPNVRIDAPTTYRELLGNVLEQTHLMALGHQEGPLARAVPVIFLALLIGVSVERWRSRRLEPADGFLLAAGVALGAHLYGAKHLIGFFERMQALPLLLLLPWLAVRPPSGLRRRALIALSCLIVMGLLAVRWPRYARASALAEEYVSVLPSIEQGSTLLSMNYDLYGRSGTLRSVSEFAAVFLHAPEYLGASDRSLVLLNNYGGLYPYFPYLWRSDRNPFVHLQRDEGIEAEPPSADFGSYHERTGGTVDYVLMVGLDASPYASHPYTVKTLEQLQRGYSRVEASPAGRAVLYKRRTELGDASQSAEDHINRSLRLFEAGQFDESLHEAEQAIALAPGSDRAYNNACAAHNALQSWDPAIAACERALTLNPDNRLARNNLAWAQRKKAAAP